ncbi:pyridoxamine 5'-phosphate oxidase family protein [Actinoallomurus acaciae]|uniref:Pyridoxamine 5'-phosphate oxidase family protein n=1 Tax=Actinoallomurus acaciae TaxID=502577 RepID=A0ABV5YCY4_9ACTN
MSSSVSGPAGPTGGNGTFGREQCLALLATASIGRIVHTDRALPAVTPVTFVLDGDVVTVRAAAMLGAAIGGSIVAFQADDVDPDTLLGWSVTVIGRAVLTGGPIPRPCSGPPGRPPALRIRVQHASGMRIGPR